MARNKRSPKPLEFSDALTSMFSEEVKPEETLNEPIQNDETIEKDKMNSSPQSIDKSSDNTPKEDNKKELTSQENHEISNISPFALNMQKKDEAAKRNVTLDPFLNEKIDFLVTDPKTGKKIKGSKGIIKKLINNALKKELVDMGVLDKSILETLEDYYE